MTRIHIQANLYEHLRNHFSYTSFHEGQEEIILDVLRGRDVLGILRTGTGKSLCYQLPAKMLPGITIVVSPLISLMIDQVRELEAIHYRQVVALHSFQQWSERQTILRNLHHYKLIYVSPEILQNKQIITLFKQQHVSLFVVDEAHCISQWGYDFRPDYLRLLEVIETLHNPTVLALTGTATPNVQNDIQDKLKRPNMIEHVYPMDRENISLVVEEINGSEAEKLDHLLTWIKGTNEPTIVYFSSRIATEKVAQHIANQLANKRVAYYHGGLETTDRLKIQQQFMNDQLEIICCTSAFGMGINKANIRMIIHYHLPPQIESYIQEIGRAGRDGRDSISVLLYRQEDIHIPLQIIENELPTHAELRFIMERLIDYQDNKVLLPLDEDVIEQQFLIQPTKWRYLLYQLEQHGIVKEQEVQTTESSIKEVFNEINHFTEQRLRAKRQQLNEVINWIHTQSCLRTKLYEPFQQDITRKEANCCSNCGVVLEDSLEHDVSTDKETSDWQTLLKRVLLIGDID